MDFYYLIASAPCRAVLMTAKALGIELNKIECNIQNNDHLSPEYLKLNPQHTIPTLVDNGFAIWESRAIMIYLVQKYGKYDNPLYPIGPKERAIINQRLFFDMGSLYSDIGDYYYSQFFFKQPADPEKFKKVETNLDFLETFLQGNVYVAGDNLTIADISILASLSTFSVFGLSLEKYPNIKRWFEVCKAEAPGWQENWEGCLMLKELIKESESPKSKV